MAERRRINVSLTKEGLKLLDREREAMGLTRSAFVEVVLRWWAGQGPAREPSERRSPSSKVGR